MSAVVPQLICPTCRKEYKLTTAFEKHLNRCTRAKQKSSCMPTPATAGKVKNETKSKSKRKTKRKIPKLIRNQVWDRWIGKKNGVGLCYACRYNEIRSTHFECGHVVAEANGGTETTDNLRPVCSECNKSMGTKNLEEYKKELTQYQPSFFASIWSCLKG